MTNLITLTIPNDDSTALYHLGKSLIDMSASITGMSEFVVITRDEYDDLTKHVGELTYKLNIDTSEATAALERLNFRDEFVRCPEVDTTPQQVESLVSTSTSFWKEQDPAKLEEMSDAGMDESGAPPTTDSTGTPWDERIHSASKALNVDGTWRLRRKPKGMDNTEWLELVRGVQDELQYLEQIKEVDEEHYAAETAEGINDIELPVTPFYTPENYVHMYRASDNIYALAKSNAELAEFEADGYVRHTQEQYDAWEGPNTADEGDDHHTDAGVVTEQTVAGIPPLPVPPPVALPGSTGATDLLPPTPVGTAVTQPTWDFPRLMTFLTERHGKIDVATVNTLLAQDGMSSVQELNAHPDKIGPFVARVKAHLGE